MQCFTQVCLLLVDASLASLASHFLACNCNGDKINGCVYLMGKLQPVPVDCISKLPSELLCLSKCHRRSGKLLLERPATGFCNPQGSQKVTTVACAEGFQVKPLSANVQPASLTSRDGCEESVSERAT